MNQARQDSVKNLVKKRLGEDGGLRTEAEKRCNFIYAHIRIASLAIFRSQIISPLGRY